MFHSDARSRVLQDWLFSARGADPAVHHDRNLEDGWLVEESADHVWTVSQSARWRCGSAALSDFTSKDEILLQAFDTIMCSRDGGRDGRF